MKHMLGLGFAGLLGIIAAALNWIWISGLATPDEFVALHDFSELKGRLA